MGYRGKGGSQKCNRGVQTHQSRMTNQPGPSQQGTGSWEAVAHWPSQPRGSVGQGQRWGDVRSDSPAGMQPAQDLRVCVGTSIPKLL